MEERRREALALRQADRAAADTLAARSWVEAVAAVPRTERERALARLGWFAGRRVPSSAHRRALGSHRG
jgi:hypothetical protein